MFRSTPAPRCAQRNCTSKAPCSLVTARCRTRGARPRWRRAAVGVPAPATGGVSTRRGRCPRRARGSPRGGRALKSVATRRAPSRGAPGSGGLARLRGAARASTRPPRRSGARPRTCAVADRSVGPDPRRRRRTGSSRCRSIRTRGGRTGPRLYSDEAFSIVKCGSQNRGSQHTFFVQHRGVDPDYSTKNAHRQVWFPRGLERRELLLEKRRRF